MDKIDHDIISSLESDGRNSYTSVARSLKMSPCTVRRRMNRLVNDGVLQIVAVVDPTKMGLNCSAFIGLHVDLDSIEEAVQALKQERNVRFLAFATGSFDIILLVDCPSQEELGTFISKKLSKIKGIRQTETFVLMKVHKRGRDPR